MDHLFEEISAKVNDLLLEQGGDGRDWRRQVGSAVVEKQAYARVEDQLKALKKHGKL